MSQEDILKALNQNRELTSSELTELTGLCRAVVNNALKQLLKYNEIEIEYSDKPIYKKKKKRRTLTSSSKNKK